MKILILFSINLIKFKIVWLLEMQDLHLFGTEGVLGIFFLSYFNLFLTKRN